jgi:thiosulfate dehydrogenase
MRARSWIALAITIAVFYVFTLALAFNGRRLLHLFHHAPPVVWQAWQLPDAQSIPGGARGASILYGKQLMENTPALAPAYVGSRLTCNHCHIAGGIAPYAAPLVGTAQSFPKFSQRAGRIITLQDRIEECFVRSENGRPLPYDSREMQALVDYIGWLSQPAPQRLPFVGRGLITLPALTPDPVRGAQIYATQCAGCHGTDGAGGHPIFPPLWGPESFNTGAGMNRIAKMAAFVQANMPQNRKGALTAQEAYDVADYIHAQPRPAFNPAYSKY